MWRQEVCWQRWLLGGDHGMFLGCVLQGVGRVLTKGIDGRVGVSLSIFCVAM